MKCHSSNEITWNDYSGHINLNGHHLLEFSTSIDKQPSSNLSKLKIRVATLWIMVGSSPHSISSEKQYSDDTVQLHQLSLKHSRHPTSLNMPRVDKTRSQTRRKRKKLKREVEAESDSNMYYFKNHSYNHITNDNNNGNHIIKSNRNANEKRRRKVKSINQDNSSKLNSTSKQILEKHREKNLTLWIFNINKSINRGNVSSIGDKVSGELVQPSIFLEERFIAFRSSTS